MKSLKLSSNNDASDSIKKRLARLKDILVFILIVVFLIGIGFLAWNFYDSHYGGKHKKAQRSSISQKNKITSVSDEEKGMSNQTNSLIKNSDWEQYQNSQLVLAYGYIQQNDFNSLGRLLLEIKKNVPNNKLIPNYYLYTFQLDQHNKDLNAQKTDLQQLIALLKAQNRGQEAENYQRQLDSISGNNATPSNEPAKKVQNL